jgi:multidrug efflux pump subunit AcrA (membrane-fusion protein)
LTVSQRALEREVGARLLTRERMVPIVLGLLAVLLAFLIVHDVFFPAAPAAAAVNAATVSMGNVRAAVTGTGTVVPAQQQNLGFGEAGTLAEVDVKVGDRVTKGQVLARLDTTQLQQALQQARNGLAQAQATLDGTVNGNTVQQAQHNLANAQQTLSDTQAQVNLTNLQDANTLTNDQNQLNNVDTPAVQRAQATFDADQCGTNPHGPSCPQDQTALTQAQNAVNQDSSKIVADQNKIATDQLAGQRSINQANNGVTTSQDALNGQTISRPNTIATQQAAVSNAQLQVQTAQRNLDMAALAAPFDGSVQSISGVAGEAVSASGGSATALAPGSTAPQPGSSAASSSSAGSGGSTFMVEGNVSAMQVVAPFAEADASRLAANQAASVTFDAVTGLTLTARVLAVANTATVVSNVTNYYATLALDSIDSRLKGGMTANASVVVQSAANVVTVPNSAIARRGATATVTLLGRDGRTQTRQVVQTGAVGDTVTEITGGLNVGERVVLPQLRTGTAAGAGTRGNLGGGGGGGGGGVRIGGG